MPKFRLPLLGFLLAVWISPCHGAVKVEGPIRIHSKVLGYDVQYWIYVPKNAVKPLPELYVTDGQNYLGFGKMAKVLDDEIEDGNIVPIAVIFVDSRDPDYPDETRRGSQFMCNVDYAKFFIGELMPNVSARWTGAGSSTRRGLMGVSAGGINSACFGMMMPGVFQVLIMQSPADAEHLAVINNLYREKPPHSSAFFISDGGAEDNAAAVGRFVQTLQDKGYAVRHISNDEGANWDAWSELIDKSLRAFAGTRAEDEIE